jgi:hypothetical protein
MDKWQEFGQHRHGIGYRANLGIFGDFGDKISGIIFTGNGHTNPQIQYRIFIKTHETISKSFDSGIGRTIEIRF